MTESAMPAGRVDFMSMTPDELTGFVVSLGEKPYRAEQLFRWMAKGAPLGEMTNLPAAFREKLAEAGEYRLPVIEKKLVSKIDGTVKYLFSSSTENAWNRSLCATSTGPPSASPPRRDATCGAGSALPR